MHENLKLALIYVAMDEGGFAVRESEPGGAVNKGVSLLVFQEWRKKQGQPEPTLEDLRAMTDEEAGEIFTAKYAAPIGFDELPSGLDYALLNTAVMEGVRGARLLLEAAMKSLPQKRSVSDIVSRLLLLHLHKKLHVNGRAKFGPGWSDRIVRVASRAQEMMNERTTMADQG